MVLGDSFAAIGGVRFFPLSEIAWVCGILLRGRSSGAPPTWLTKFFQTCEQGLGLLVRLKSCYLRWRAGNLRSCERRFKARARERSTLLANEFAHVYPILHESYPCARGRRTPEPGPLFGARLGRLCAWKGSALGSLGSGGISVGGSTLVRSSPLSCRRVQGEVLVELASSRRN